MLRSQYDKLFALIGTKFGAADEAHFNLPNLHHRFIEGTTTLSEVGSYVEAGLPNIIGYSNIAGYYDLATSSGGAFSACSRWTFSIVREPGNSGGIVNIDASGSDPLYGASNTVQPKGLFVQCLIRYS